MSKETVKMERRGKVKDFPKDTQSLMEYHGWTVMVEPTVIKTTEKKSVPNEVKQATSKAAPKKIQDAVKKTFNPNLPD